MATAAPVAPARTTPPTDPLPLDTNLDVLAEVVASPRCAPAIDPLLARVAKDDADAKSWALLAQCYAKRRRLRNAVEAYDKAIARGDPALQETLRPQAEAARAALQAAAQPEAAPAHE